MDLHEIISKAKVALVAIAVGGSLATACANPPFWVPLETPKVYRGEVAVFGNGYAIFRPDLNLVLSSGTAEGKRNCYLWEPIDRSRPFDFAVTAARFNTTDSDCNGTVDLVYVNDLPTRGDTFVFRSNEGEIERLLGQSLSSLDKMYRTSVETILTSETKR